LVTDISYRGDAVLEKAQLLLGRTVPELQHDLFIIPVSDFTAVLRAVEHLYLIKMQYLHYYMLLRQDKAKVVVHQGHHMEMVVAHQAQRRGMCRAKVVVRQGHHMEMVVAHQAQPQSPC
jgi:hypothetical protein